jgi:hypothetical protein
MFSPKSLEYPTPPAICVVDFRRILAFSLAPPLVPHFVLGIGTKLATYLGVVSERHMAKLFGFVVALVAVSISLALA